MTSFKTAAILAFPIFAGVSVTADRPEAEPECVVARRWVSEHAAALPSTLTAFSQHASAYRRAIFAALPKEAQLRLWQEQLTYFATSPELTSSQREFLTLALERLPAVFGPEHRGEAKAGTCQWK